MYSVHISELSALPFRTVVRREKDRTCAAAALATLLRHHYALAFSEAEILSALGASGGEERIAREGPSLLDLCLFLNGLGLEANGHRLTLDRLAMLRTPAIALVDDRVETHFVVIKGVRDNEVLVGDPALSLRRYTRQEFGRCWNGIALTVDPARVRGVFNDPGEWRAARPMTPAAPAFH
jgi:uncharacterized protein